MLAGLECPAYWHHLTSGLTVSFSLMSLLLFGKIHTLTPNNNIQPTLSYRLMKDPRTAFCGLLLHISLISSPPVIQIPVALVAPNTDRPLVGTVGTLCWAEVLAYSTVVGKLSLE